MGSLWLRLSLPGGSTDNRDPSEILLGLPLHLPPQWLGTWSCLPKLMPAFEEDTESGSTGPRAPGGPTGSLSIPQADTAGLASHGSQTLTSGPSGRGDYSQGPAASPSSCL